MVITMPDPDEVYELPDEDMCEVPGSRLRELADKAAFLEAALAEEREKNERLRKVAHEYVIRSESINTYGESWRERLLAALASTGSENETCGADLTDRNDEHRLFVCRKPVTHIDSHQDGDCTWTDETHYEPTFFAGEDDSWGRPSTGSEEPEGMEGP